MTKKTDNTKLTNLFSLVLAALPLTISGAACTIDAERIGSAEQDLVVIEGESCVTLYGGQDIDTGTVCVSIDNEVDTSAECGQEGASGAMLVELSTINGWELVEAHLAAGLKLADIPTNSKGNPKIGHFPYHSGDITGATSHSFSVPLCTFDLDASMDECDPVKALLSAHAALRKDNGDGTYQTETGWGNGRPLTAQGSWAELFGVELTCEPPTAPPEPPPVMECETAFAYGGRHATCFIGADFDGDGMDDGFSRWGWSNGPLGAGSYYWKVYAGAGQCDLDKGTVVGALEVDYDGSTAIVKFTSTGDFALEEDHIYVGNEPLHQIDGEYTVSPGLFPIKRDLDGAETTAITVLGLRGDLHIVYHAVACEI